MKTRVRIYDLAATEEFYSADIILKYTSTVLHEMVHSLVAIYVCDCASCHLYRSTSQAGSRGGGGHGKGWAQIAADVLSIKVELRVLKCISLEMILAQQSPHEWLLSTLRIKPLHAGKTYERLATRSSSWYNQRGVCEGSEI